MLVDAVGDRHRHRPATAIVRDPRRPGGVVENGISCFGCHGGVGMTPSPALTKSAATPTPTWPDFLGREFNEISGPYPPVFTPDLFTADYNRYRLAVDTVDGGGPSRTEAEYSDFVALIGQYESNVGFRGAAAEFNEDPAPAATGCWPTTSPTRLPALPPRTRSSRATTSSASTGIWWSEDRPNAQFCAKTFDAAAVVGLCK